MPIYQYINVSQFKPLSPVLPVACATTSCDRHDALVAPFLWIPMHCFSLFNQLLEMVVEFSNGLPYLNQLLDLVGWFKHKKESGVKDSARSIKEQG